VTGSLGLTREDLVLLAKNSFTGSFLDEERVALHLQAIDAYAAANA
jgi:adenosine deaminase